MFAEYRVNGPGPYVSRVAVSTDQQKRPIKSDVMFLSCANDSREPLKYAGNKYSRRNRMNAASSLSASHFAPYHARVCSMMWSSIFGSASTIGSNAPVAMESSTSCTE